MGGGARPGRGRCIDGEARVKFSTFVEVFVAAIYNEMQQTGQTQFSVGDILDRYGLRFDAGWRDTFFRDYTATSLLDMRRRHLGPIRQQHLALSAEGIRWVEENLGDNVTTFLEQNGAIYQSGATFESRAADEVLQSYKSSTWTGIEERITASPEILAKVTANIREIDVLVDQSGLTNAERARAKAITQSLAILVESPEPEWRAIVALLNSPFLTGLLNVAAIAQLTLKLLFGIG